MTLETALDAHSPEAQAIRERMAGLVAELRYNVEVIRLSGGEAARQRHLSHDGVTSPFAQNCTATPMHERLAF